MVLVMGVAAFALSFGPAFPPYRWLYGVFPLLTGIRGAVRLGQVVIAAVGILAGFGLAAILKKAPGRAAAPIAIALILAANLEAFRAPLGYTEYRGIPGVLRLAPPGGRRRGPGVDAVLCVAAVPPERSVHAGVDAVLEADAERLLGVQAGELLPERRRAPQFPGRRVDCAPALAGRDARRRRRPQHGAGGARARWSASRSCGRSTSDGNLRLYLLSGLGR